MVKKRESGHDLLQEDMLINELDADDELSNSFRSSRKSAALPDQPVLVKRRSSIDEFAQFQERNKKLSLKMERHMLEEEQKNPKSAGEEPCPICYEE
jgi:hypothetical protein